MCPQSLSSINGFTFSAAANVIAGWGVTVWSVTCDDDQGLGLYGRRRLFPRAAKFFGDVERHHSLRLPDLVIRVKSARFRLRLFYLVTAPVHAVILRL